MRNARPYTLGSARFALLDMSLDIFGPHRKKRLSLRRGTIVFQRSILPEREGG